MKKNIKILLECLQIVVEFAFVSSFYIMGFLYFAVMFWALYSMTKKNYKEPLKLTPITMKTAQIKSYGLKRDYNSIFIDNETFVKYYVY